MHIKVQRKYLQNSKEMTLREKQGASVKFDKVLLCLRI